MALRAKPPSAVEKRLKLFLFGTAGVGKSTACCQLPKPYFIDAERGVENYEALINSVGGAVFQTTDMDEVIKEVRSLLTEKHDYKTLVIDPLTPLYNDLLDKAEAKVGSDYGRHFGSANKVMKRLVNLLMSLDMNVVITSHAKPEYGPNLTKLGNTFDSWKSADYFFDLVIELQKKGKKRTGRVVKTRLSAFPDEDVFDWSYEVLKRRCGESLDREATIVKLASDDQVKRLRGLLEVVRLPDGTIDKWLAKAVVDTFEDMPADVIGKCIAYTESRLPEIGPNANGERRLEPVEA